MGGRSYSQDLRSRVLASDELSARQAAARFKVSISYVVKARQRRDRTGEVGTRPRGSRRAPVLAIHGAAIAAQVARYPSITLADLRAWLGREHGIAVGMTTVWLAVRRLGLTLKKNRSAPVSKRGRISSLRARPGAICNGD
jgi:transposase